MKSILNIILGVFLLAFIVVGIWIFKWWMPWMSYEITWKHLTETHLKTWDYNIWKQKNHYNICHNENWCIDWKILWLKQTNNDDIYIYIDINYWNLVLWDENGVETKYYDYNIYKNSNRVKVISLLELPKYGKLSNNNLKFYSKNDLEKLSEEQKKIFESLEKNPSIIIDWINYSK